MRESRDPSPRLIDRDVELGSCFGAELIAPVLPDVLLVFLLCDAIDWAGKLSQFFDILDENETALCLDRVFAFQTGHRLGANLIENHSPSVAVDRQSAYPR